MGVFLIAFGISLVLTLLIVHNAHLHGHITNDHDLEGVQKFHVTPVPRVGGLPLVGGLIGSLLYSASVAPSQFHFLG